jgi:serine/threonine protein kinase
MGIAVPNRVRFGLFQLDPLAGELHKSGRKILLQEQPFQVLLMLLEHRGEVVTREEIRKRLWPNDTIVEFEHSISSAMNRLRQALADSADNPHYIETVARRGYRLMVQVEWAGAAQSAEQTPTEHASRQDATPQEIKFRDRSLTGTKVSHYRVLEILGGGEMGVVYKAEDLTLGRRVALKFLPEELASDPVALERFGREARAASALEHPNICPIYEFGEHEGQPFIVMQLLEGETLRERIAHLPIPHSSHSDANCAGPRKGPFGTVQLLDVAIQVADGLEAAHQKGIIHRDIKPGNIFITARGETKILDYGLAKVIDISEEDPNGSSGQDGHATHSQKGSSTLAVSNPRLTRTGTAIGTAAYMSPEQVRNEPLDARTDLFSFGVVLYEMASGRQAFPGNTAVIHAEILNRTPTPVLELSPNTARTGIDHQQSPREGQKQTLSISLGNSERSDTREVRGSSARRDPK